LKTKVTKCYKDPKTGRWKVDRAYQRKRSREWRQRFYAVGLTYKKIGGKWGWTKKQPKPLRTRIHSSDPTEIERIKRKILEARK